jgi:hypothetical protein
MSQPPDQHPQWWQPPANPDGTPQAHQQATGPHGGQWQQSPDPGVATGSHTGQWAQAQPGTTGSFSGPWQQPAPGTHGGQWRQPPSQPLPPQPGTPGGGWPAQPGPATPGQGQQYGGGFQPSQYGGLGAFSVEPEKKPASKKPLLIGLVALLVLALGGGAAWLLGAFRGDVLEQKSLQDGVIKVLNENYGEPDVKNADCPADEAARNGTTFDCTVQIGGQPKKVTVRVLNDRPEYEVGAPH